MIEVYSKSKVITDWLISVEKELEKVCKFNFHFTLDSIKNELELKSKSSIVIIDLTDNNFSLYTKDYFRDAKNIKFIGVALSIDLNNLKYLIESNITAFIEAGNNSFEFLKAIKYVQNNKIYFCEQSKEHILFELICQIKNSNNSNFKNNDYIHDSINNTKVLEIKALSEREKKVVQLLTQGLSYKEIALILNVTTFAINQNAKNIYKKLNVRSRSELSYKILQ